MMSLPSDYSWQPGPYRLLIEQFDALGLPRRLLGRTLFDMPIYAYRVGSTGPEVMVTAGAHAEEVAGVVTAYHLARNFPSGLQGWIVPCRDPLGWDGFAAACTGRSAMPWALKTTVTWWMLSDATAASTRPKARWSV